MLRFIGKAIAGRGGTPPRIRHGFTQARQAATWRPFGVAVALIARQGRTPLSGRLSVQGNKPNTVAGSRYSSSYCVVHRHKYLRLMDDPGRGVDDGHGLAGIIGLHHRTRSMAIAEGRARPAFESGVALAEPGVAVAVGMGCAILLPKQRQRHPLALQFAGDQRKIRFMLITGRPAGTTEQQPLECGIIVMNRRQRPGEPSLPRAQQIGRDRRLADLQPFRNLAHRQTLFMGQAQDRAYILHCRSSRLLPSRHGPSQRHREGRKCQNGAAENRPP